MSALSIQVPFPVFQDRDGQPLDNGYVWLGTSSLNPQTNPVVAYYDSALTIVATQPLRTLNGFISRAGSPAQVYVDAVNFSILVQDRQGTTVFSVPEGTGISPNASGVVYDPAGTGAVATTVQAALRLTANLAGYGGIVDATTDDTTALANTIARQAPTFISGEALTDKGKIGPSIINVRERDVTTIGANQLTNSTVAGSPATGWTLSNFTSNNPGLTHAAGSAASASRAVTLAAYMQYQVSVTLSTTTLGGFTVNINAVNILDSGVYHRTPVQGSTTYTFPWVTSASGSLTFEFLSDTSWAGQVTDLSIFEVVNVAPQDFVSVPTDDLTVRIPNGIRFGRFNAGNVCMGDKLTGALLGTSASWNLAMGARALWGNVSGIENTAAGAFALQSCVTDRTVAVGYSALKNLTTGIQNTGVGYKAAGSLSTGTDNHFFGFHAGLQLATGSFNCGFGTQALYSEFFGTYNTAFGHQAGLSSASGTANTYFGALAGRLHASNTYTYSNGAMFGDQSKVWGNSGTAVGSLAQVGADGAPVNNAMALGASAKTLIANTAKIGSGLTATNVGGRLFSNQVFSSDATAAGITYTAAQFVNTTMLIRTGPAGPVNDTTPTAAQIVAAIPGCEVGSGYDIWIRNGSANTITVLGGTNMAVSFTNTIAAGYTRHFKINISNIGAGTEAGNIVCVSTAAN